MAHPHKTDADKAKGSKFHRMTRDYGMAGGKDKYMVTPEERLKDETDTPEDSVGFGADSAAASARSDRPARRSVPANPLATYAKGGAVKGDKSGLDNQSKLKIAARPHKAAKTGPVKGDKSGLTNEDKLPVPGRARGGRLHGKKGATHVNVIVAPQGGSPAGAGGPPPQLAGLLPGAHPPMGGPPMGGPPPGPPMPPPGGPPGMPPGGPPMPMRAKGGKVMGDHPDAAQDKEMIKKTLREEGLVRKARGGGIHMEAGAATGIGRLEKMHLNPPLHKGSMKPQAV